MLLIFLKTNWGYEMCMEYWKEKVVTVQLTERFSMPRVMNMCLTWFELKLLNQYAIKMIGIYLKCIYQQFELVIAASMIKTSNEPCPFNSITCCLFGGFLFIQMQHINYRSALISEFWSRGQRWGDDPSFWTS